MPVTKPSLPACPKLPSTETSIYFKLTTLRGSTTISHILTCYTKNHFQSYTNAANRKATVLFSLSPAFLFFSGLPPISSSLYLYPPHSLYTSREYPGITSQQKRAPNHALPFCNEGATPFLLCLPSLLLTIAMLSCNFKMLSAKPSPINILHFVPFQLLLRIPF